MQIVLKKMRLINDNIIINKWYIQGRFIDFKVDGIKSAKYTIFYYNIIQLLQFVIQYKRFE